MIQKYFIGVDISKDKLDIALLDERFNVILEKQITNKDEKILSFIKSVQRKLKVSLDEFLVCCETTGIYGKPLFRACELMNVALWVEQAIKIKRASSDLRGKSDRKDALRIAEYALRYQDRKIIYQSPSQDIQDMEVLCKVRETLLKQKVAIENQLREAQTHDPKLYKSLSSLYNKTIKTLTKELAELDNKIKVSINSNEAIKRNIDLLKTVPGIGKTVALQIIIETQNFKKFESPKQLACYAGVVPFANESGKIIKKARVSKLANMKLKKLLHLAAMSASRSKSELKDYYIRKVQEGKNKLSVINALRNKLVHRMWAVVQRQLPYQSQEIFLNIKKIA